MLTLASGSMNTTTELFTADGLPDESLKEQIYLRSQAVVESVFGARNQVSMSQPEVASVLAMVDAQPGALSPFITQHRDHFDFWLIHWACSFRAAPDCEFIRASVQVQLEVEPDRSPGAVAIDMFPREIETPLTLKRTFKLSPELKLSFAEVLKAEMSAGAVENSAEYLHYEPAVTTFALGEATPSWEFTATKARPVRGSRDLFLLVKKPISSTLWGRFQLTATIRTSIGRIPLPMFINRKNDKPLVDDRFKFTIAS